MARNAPQNKIYMAGKPSWFRNEDRWFSLIRFYFIAMVFAFFHTPSIGLSASDQSYVCDQATNYASQQTGVPVSVLQAISLTETGRKSDGVIRPWPWTVNMEGKGVWFRTEDEARAYVFKNYKRGARSFDVGCFQINYKWHGHNFSSIEEMFDPTENALYAANFLSRLYQEKGEWGAAAGAYHSRTAKYADKYEKRFTTLLASLLNNVDAPPLALNLALVPASSQQPIPTEPVARVNLYPLLRENGSLRTPGSLVPIGGQQPARKLIAIGG